jgi:uncharacterized protein YndB with AHSA1/START domain
MSTIVLTLVLACTIGLLLAALATPRKVEYVETITIAAPPVAVYDAIRYQRDLMQWSAWPSETNSSCTIAGPDGALGARTLFLDRKGREFGHQEVVALEPHREVALTLTSKGPPQHPLLRFLLVPMSEGETHVLLHFTNRIAPPVHLLLRIAGVVAWTRAMHGKDLAGLKRWCENGVPYAAAA